MEPSPSLAPNNRIYLGPDQVEQAREEIKALEAKLLSPHIQDKGAARSQLIRVRQQTESQAPKPPENAVEEGRLVERERILRAEIVESMCSQEEMRKSPPGAVDKFNKGENSPAVKRKIVEWKNIRLRIMPGEREAANIERFRPVSSSLNMDNAVIPGRQFYMPPGDLTVAVVFSDDELAKLRQLKPSLADGVGAMSNDQRALVKELLESFEVKPAKPSFRDRIGADA